MEMQSKLKLEKKSLQRTEDLYAGYLKEPMG